MIISERAIQIPDEALTVHHMEDMSTEFTASDISNAYITGAKDVIEIVKRMYATRTIKDIADGNTPDYEGILNEILLELNDIDR